MEGGGYSLPLKESCSVRRPSANGQDTGYTGITSIQVLASDLCVLCLDWGWLCLIPFQLVRRTLMSLSSPCVQRNETTGEEVQVTGGCVCDSRFKVFEYDVIKCYTSFDTHTPDKMQNVLFIFKQLVCLTDTVTGFYSNRLCWPQKWQKIVICISQTSVSSRGMYHNISDITQALTLVTRKS